MNPFLRKTLNLGLVLALMLSSLLVFSSVQQAHALTTNFDVSAVFNGDVILNYTGGALDTTQTGLDTLGSVLLTQSAAQNHPSAPTDPDGLPDNGFFPANTYHPDVQLAYHNDDSGDNVRLIPLYSTGSFIFNVPNANYTEVHIFALSTEGPSQIRLTFHYSDASTQTTTVSQVPDWFSTISESQNLYYLIDGMDRVEYAYNPPFYFDANTVAVFGLRFLPDSNKVLQQITVEKTSYDGTLVFLGALGNDDPLPPPPPLVNPGFETGDFTGWLSGGSSSVIAGTAPYGSYYASVTPDNCTWGTLTQTFSGTAGTTIAGQALFVDAEYMSTTYNDWVQLRIVETNTVLFYRSSSMGGTGWLPWSYQIPYSGPFTLEAVSANSGDCGFASSLLLDLPSAPPNTPPTANAGGPYNLAAGSSLNLDGSGSIDPDQDTNTLTFAWDLDNNGSYETAGMTPLFDASALAPGVYTVGLQVTDDQSASDADTTTVTVFTTSAFNSDGYSDGWVLERAETYNTGYTTDNKTKLLRIGDDRADRQYKAILSFDTSTLNGNAQFTAATLLATIYGQVGDPASLGQVCLDAQNGYFHSSWRLERQDFEAPAAGSQVTCTTPDQDGQLLFSVPSGYLNPGGWTQFRLSYELDDNDNRADDYLMIYGGYAGGNAPILEVEFIP